ncbi:hypothetical protein Theba_1198 [Mesotoga prima MesG1.Ag.4.2]|uniref:Uncharacterized protein n=1 Tax=Mesotoga prima MesG1.Ag.4.2 TaxID=660470 RepID=I2F4P2_9BACT|nr:hypothetical protein [Mesotoga prima]AFK06895.1 hypothetical protein Theba_1198 [Mesotoga prima MesG1.Ag.4.2]
MPGRAYQEVMPGETSGEVMLLRRKLVKQDVNGSPTRTKSQIYGL